MIDFLSFSSLVVLNDFDLFSEMYDDVNEAVVYSVNGGERNSGGLSFFFPLTYNRDEIDEYISLGISEKYNAFLSEYYLDVPSQTIAFSDKGSLSDDGSYKITLTPNSTKYLSTVTYRLITVHNLSRKLSFLFLSSPPEAGMTKKEIFLSC